MGRSNKGSGFIPLLIVLILSLAISGAIYFLFYQEKTTNTRLNVEISNLETKNGSLQSQLDEATRKVTGLQASVDEAQQKVTQLTADLEKERQQKKESGTQLAQVQQALDQEKTLKAELERKLTESQQTLAALDARVKEMEGKLKELDAAKTALENKVKDYEDKKDVELGKIVVNPDGGAAPSPTVAPVATAKSADGKILVVNKEYNFAVINLGEKDGITIGDVFTVYRNNKPQSELKIEKVHEAMSAAGFTPDVKDKIAEGDRVELKK
jgi:predicted RNase H-like nuclease (RuvC/YqgF family)